MKLQTCLLFIIALPVIIILFVIIGIPILALSFGALSSIIGAIREMLLPLVCIFAAITIIGITFHFIGKNTDRKNERNKQKKNNAREEDIARFEALSTPEEYVAYYEEKLQEQRADLQRAKANGMKVGRNPHVRYLYERISETKKTIKSYKDMADIPKRNTDEKTEIRPEI